MKKGAANAGREPRKKFISPPQKTVGFEKGRRQRGVGTTEKFISPPQKTVGFEGVAPSARGGSHDLSWAPHSEGGSDGGALTKTVR